jgi:hypothetical protein
MKKRTSWEAGCQWKLMQMILVAMLSIILGKMVLTPMTDGNRLKKIAEQVYYLHFGSEGVSDS